MFKIADRFILNTPWLLAGMWFKFVLYLLSDRFRSINSIASLKMNAVPGAAIVFIYVFSQFTEHPLLSEQNGIRTETSDEEFLYVRYQSEEMQAKLLLLYFQHRSIELFSDGFTS